MSPVVLRTLIGIATRSAERGTLTEILETVATLARLVAPLLAEVAHAGVLEQPDAASPGTPRPAQPEDPALARQGAPKFGGR